ncbi:MAG: penicillin-binding protein 2 [Lentisphaerae bacterium]|nr:penicillin-binding protein 2 [Lentisphaerota bacterium]
MRSRNDTIRSRIRFQAGLLILFFVYLLGKLYWVQVHRHDYYYTEARKKYVASEKLKGARGEIFDAQGNLLVGNMPCQDVSITPCNIKSKYDKNIALIISRLLKLDYQTVLAKVSNKTRIVTDKNGNPKTLPRQYAMIARNVPLPEARHLQEVLRSHKLGRHVHFDDTFIRYYPKGRLGANVLGTTFMDNDELSGSEGVERFFNKELSSGDGLRTFERSLDGRKLINTVEESIDGLDGRNIYLTIQEPIQSILEEELDKAYIKWKPEVVYAVMADPSGNILAIAQRPSFDPNDRKVRDTSGFRTRVASDAYEPGSIMKPLTVAGAMDYGLVTPDSKVDCENKIWFFRGKSLTDSHAYGMQDVTGVIRKSSNIGTAKIAIAMGEQRLYRTLRKFGIGSRTGIALKPESRGNLRPPSKWDGLSISRFGIGYGVSVTSVQMLRAYCALANRGKLPQLRILDRVEDPQSGKVEYNRNKPMRNIYMRPDTGEKIVNMMVTVTEKGGTAVKAAIPGYRVAGKTGTSRKWKNGGYHGDYFASFAGFVPAEKPAFVLVLTFDAPKGSIYGGSVAAPTWKAIAERTLKYMNVPPTVPVEEKSSGRR